MSPLTLNQITQQLTTLPHWTYDEHAAHIRRRFEFPDFYHTMAFVNAIAWIAHETNHHPDLTLSYAHCVVAYCTHDAKGITLKDFQCAEKIDACFSRRNLT